MAQEVLAHAGKGGNTAGGVYGEARGRIDARQSRDFVIVARTDARATDGLDAAIQRGQQNKKTGADAVFIEAPKVV